MKIHKAGYPLLVKALVVYAGVNVPVCLTLPVARYVVLAVTTLLYLLVLNFFRFPRRQITVDDNTILAPADGRIVVIEETFESEYLKRPCLQVSVFMNIFNVHINWFAVNGTITYFKHHPGRHVAAYLPKSSSENERATIAIRTPAGEEVVMRQIAGAMAHRIVSYATEGTEARQDRHAGFIKFGSRVDLFLPLDTMICVRLSEKVTGSRTILGRFKNTINPS
ncbi:MAG: phosphatidylserine decarboxylase family protein [Odoribacteraceae bacterium]|jgi:phosphatidylserine decarboxylase|nr:phosphatidylserine decarboxylase family protein [Odoribacteraceae bacterium]